MKTLGWLIATVAISIAAPAQAQAPAKKAAPATQNWTRVVALTPEGGFRMGNPNAKVKIVEYGSMTCPHCAEFAVSAKAPLAQRVRTGMVSFEFRNFVLNGVDLTASLIARCGGTSRFFALTDRFFATQSQWVGKISGMSHAQKQQVEAAPDVERLARVADIAGLTEIAAAQGLPPAQAKKCLADPAALQRLGQMYEAASALGVKGTPTFFVNGARVHAHDWAELQAEISKAGG